MGIGEQFEFEKTGQILPENYDMPCAIQKAIEAERARGNMNPVIMMVCYCPRCRPYSL